MHQSPATAPRPRRGGQNWPSSAKCQHQRKFGRLRPKLVQTWPKWSLSWPTSTKIDLVQANWVRSRTPREFDSASHLHKSLHRDARYFITSYTMLRHERSKTMIVPLPWVVQICGRLRARFGRFRAKSGSFRANVGRCLLNAVQLWYEWDNHDRTRAQHWSTPGQLWSKLADSGRDQVCGYRSVGSCRGRSKFGRSQAEFGRVWPNSAQIRPNRPGVVDVVFPKILSHSARCRRPCKRPAVAERLVPESCRTILRHESWNVTAGEPGEL